MFVRPEERPFVTAELIRLTTFAATERELKDRIAALAAAGYTEIAIQIVVKTRRKCRCAGRPYGLLVLPAWQF